MMSLRKTIGIILSAFLCAGSSARAVEVLRIMPLGDSNTRGTVVGYAGPHPAAIGAGGYRYPLQQILTNGGYRFDFVGSQTTDSIGEQGSNPPDTWVFDPTFSRNHQGLPGFTNDRLITGGSVPNWPGEEDSAPPLVTTLVTYRPDVVLLMSGTNGLGLASLDRVIRTITTNSPNTQLIVGTIYDRWLSYGKDPATEAYNLGIPGLVLAAQQRGEHVSFVDTGNALTQADFYWVDGFSSVRPPDGVHPNPLSLGKVAEVWYAGIQQVVPVPEPSAIVLLAAGAAVLLAYTVRKRT